jgi:hypothetical protein
VVELFVSGHGDTFVSVALLVDEVLNLGDDSAVALAEEALEFEVLLEGGVGDSTHILN